MAKQKKKKTLAKYTVSDGEMVLSLEECEEGGYLVRSPFDPALITQAESLEEAFFMARDAAEALAESRAGILEKVRLEKMAS